MSTGNTTKATTREVAAIIPCYRSQDYLESTVHELLGTLANQPGLAPTVILVNDASPDDTWGAIKLLVDAFPGTVVGLDLASNVGQSRAKMAGLAFASEAVVFMDDDGQHDPASIPAMLAKLDEGYDLVYAAFPRLAEARHRKMASKLLDMAMTCFASKPASIRITSFLCVGPRALCTLLDYDSLHPFIGGYLFDKGMRATTIPSCHRSRTTESSRYSFGKLAGRAIELCALSRRPRKAGDPPMFNVREVYSR